MTVRGCTWLQVVFGCPEWTLVLPLGLYSGRQVIMVPVNTQSPHSSLHVRVKRSQPHTQPHKKCFLYNFGTRFPFHISILLGVAERNLSQFGVSLLFLPVSCAKSSEKEAAPRDSRCGFVTTEQPSFLLGLQRSFCAKDLPFPDPPAPSCVPLFSYFHVICGHQVSSRASHAMLVVRDWTFVSGLFCPAQHSFLQGLPAALLGEVA